MNKEFFVSIKNYFPEIYVDFLTKVIYKDNQLVSDLFSEQEVKDAFFDVVNSVYSGEDFGKDFDKEIKTKLKKYEKLCGDENLRHFIKLYSFYSKDSKNFIIDTNNNYHKEKEQLYFTNLKTICFKNYNSLKTDLIHGNYWWEFYSPITLRMQFLSNKLILSKNKLQKLCKKYLGREIDVVKELHLNQNVKMPPLELIKELDEKMNKAGLKVAYSWLENVDGKTTIITSDKKPKDRYYITKYISNKQSENYTNENKNFEA